MPEPKIVYEKFEKKTQRGLFVKAPSWERLYINAALAITDYLVSMDRLKVVSRKQLMANGTTLPLLMENWLQAVLNLFNHEQFLAQRIVFDSFDGKSIKATLHGEPYDRIRHGSIVPTVIEKEPPLETGDSPTPDPTFFVRFCFRDKGETV